MKKIVLLIAAVFGVVLSVHAELGHPILFAKNEDFVALKKSCETNDTMALLRGRLLYDADALLSQAPAERTLTGRRLLSISRRTIWRISTLAMAYRLTEKKEYRDRCVQEMLAVSAFKDWNPAHFLDVAEMSLAVSIGYDWLYNDLSADQRETIATALFEKGLLESYKTAKGKPLWWVRGGNNWNQVCHGGMVAAAVVLWDRCGKDYGERTIQRAVTNLPVCSLKEYAPRGSYPEGLSYWDYATSYSTVLIAILEKAFGTDYGLLDVPGFRETADYPNFVTGPSGFVFGYVDCNQNREISPPSIWFAKRLNRPDILIYRDLPGYIHYAKARPVYEVEGSTNGTSGSIVPPLFMCGGPGIVNEMPKASRFFPVSLLWFQVPPADSTPRAPLNFSSGGSVPITIQRTSWNDDVAAYAGLKAGRATSSHGHMDAGSFVYDSQKLRWSCELGGESYTRVEQEGINLWSLSQNSPRWDLLRLGNHGHSSLIINDQRYQVTGDTKVLSLTETNNTSVSTLDLTPAFPMTRQVLRKGTMYPDGNYQLDDTIQAVPGTKVRWQMVTPAKIETDNGAALVLVQKGKHLRISAEHNPKITWQIKEISTPAHDWECSNPNRRILFFEDTVGNSGELALRVKLTNLP